MLQAEDANLVGSLGLTARDSHPWSAYFTHPLAFQDGKALSLSSADKACPCLSSVEGALVLQKFLSLSSHSYPVFGFQDLSSFSVRHEHFLDRGR